MEEMEELAVLPLEQVKAEPLVLGGRQPEHCMPEEAEEPVTILMIGPVQPEELAEAEQAERCGPILA